MCADARDRTVRLRVRGVRAARTLWRGRICANIPEAKCGYLTYARRGRIKKPSIIILSYSRRLCRTGEACFAHARGVQNTVVQGDAFIRVFRREIRNLLFTADVYIAMERLRPFFESSGEPPRARQSGNIAQTTWRRLRAVGDAVRDKPGKLENKINARVLRTGGHRENGP